MAAEQLQQMQAQCQELAQQFQQSQAREQALTAELTRLQGFADMPNILAQMAENQKSLVEAMQSSSKDRVSLVDNKGIGKPQRFDGKNEERFLPWKTRIANFVGNVFPDMVNALDWAEEQISPIVEGDVDGVPSLARELGNDQDPENH